MQEVTYYDLKKIRVDKTPRPVQTQLLEFSKQSVLSNMKNIIIDCPTGVGKSVFSVMFMDWYKKHYDISATFDILTDSKILQEQYTNEFDFMHSLWGKGSYQCEKYNCSCDVGQEWARIQGTKCESCPYTTAKYKFENGDVALTNFHLFLTYKLYMPMAWKRSSRVLIIDECLHPETLITMSDDSKKMIKDVKVGELVKTINEETRVIESKPIVKVHYNLNKGQQMYEMEMEDGTILKITGNHKIQLTNRQWVKVEDLSGNEDILYIK